MQFYSQYYEKDFMKQVLSSSSFLYLRGFCKDCIEFRCNEVVLSVFVSIFCLETLDGFLQNFFAGIRSKKLLE